MKCRIGLPLTKDTGLRGSGVVTPATASTNDFEGIEAFGLRIFVGLITLGYKGFLLGLGWCSWVLLF